MLLAQSGRTDPCGGLVLIVGARRRDAWNLRRLSPVVLPEDRPDHDHHVEQRLARVRLPPRRRPRVEVEPGEDHDHHHDDRAQNENADQSPLRPKSLRPTKRTGSQCTSATRSLSGMIALSVMWMCSGHTSVQHLVMLQYPSPPCSRVCSRRSRMSLGCISSEATRTKNRGP